LKHYEVKEGTACHVFMGAQSFEELLAAIVKWWSSIDEESKTMEAITFTVDDGMNAMVHWNYLTEETKQEVERMLLTPRELDEPPCVRNNLS